MRYKCPMPRFLEAFNIRLPSIYPMIKHEHIRVVKEGKTWRSWFVVLPFEVPAGERYIDASAAAEAIFYSVGRVRYFVQTGKLRGYKVGRRYKIPVSAIREYKARRG